jgi:hypothetical protein
MVELLLLKLTDLSAEGWMPVEEVWAEDGQGKPMSESILPVHLVGHMPRPKAGN